MAKQFKDDPKTKAKMAKRGKFTISDIEMMTNSPNPNIVEEHTKALIGAGAPKLKHIIQRVLSEITAGDGDSELAVILRKQIQKAKLGDTKAAEFLLNRAYGMPTQTVENIGENSNTSLVVTIVNPK